MGKLLSLAAPYWLYIKLGTIIVLICAVAGFSYNYRGLKIQEEVDEAVSDATREINRAYSLEQERRQNLQMAIDGRYDVLIAMIGKIKTGNTIINQTIKQEIKDNPAFYNQPLTPQGYEQWLKARALMSATPPASPASPPQR